MSFSPERRAEMHHKKRLTYANKYPAIAESIPKILTELEYPKILSRGRIRDRLEQLGIELMKKDHAQAISAILFLNGYKGIGKRPSRFRTYERVD